ncbi:Bll4347 protein [plant metagenome]|uniref:Bll4347 protein n=1 Tax=plant metagenome TaxID=1297885 RepID=A0A484RD25_9ZZZZ
MIGTLFAGAAMMFWEHRSNPARSSALRTLAAGFAVLAIGCVGALYRRDLPSPYGAALANFIIVTGYLLVLNGVASLNGRRYGLFGAGLLACTVSAWLIAGAAWQEVMWNYISAIPIALVSALTAWEMWRCAAMKSFPTRHIVVGVTFIHAFLYGARAAILPWLVTAEGPPMQAFASMITIYAGVLYSMLLPMALLKVFREEAHGQLLKESMTDYLTRLGNRKRFFEEGARQLQGAGRGPVAFLAFDLDHFKLVNDRHGHQTGDEVLQSFAEIARSVMGPGAMLARIGGEEFAGLLTGEEARHAQALGEAVAQAFAGTIASRVGNSEITVTVSIGLAHYEGQLPSLGDGLAAADRALYRAKSQGGNRVETA